MPTQLDSLMLDYQIDLNNNNGHLKAFQCQSGSECCQDMRRSEDVFGDAYGTTNIISIFGGIIIIASDSRITSKGRL
ncbi:hypothetical protein FRX31_005497, partial [Thalictrum thalictroides]